MGGELKWQRIRCKAQGGGGNAPEGGWRVEVVEGALGDKRGWGK